MTIQPFDCVADHVAATARRLQAEIGWRRVTVSLEDREAVARFMSTDVTWREKSWQGERVGRDGAPWHMVQDAVIGWRDFGDFLSGVAFRDVLGRCLELGGSQGWADCVPSCSMDATASSIIEATKAAIIEANEDGVIDEDDLAVLSLPPAVLVAVQLRMEGRFMEAIREDPELIIDGSVESIQRNIQDLWGRMLEWLTASEAQEAASA